MGAAAVLRLGWVGLVPSEPVSDGVIYHVGAVQILRGAGFAFADGDPNGFWPVGYSALLSLAYRLFGAHHVVAHLLNAVLGVILVWLVFVLGVVTGSRRAGLVAAWAAAVYPTFVMYTTAVASEHLYDPMLVAFAAVTIVVWRADRDDRPGARGWVRIAAAGGLVGALVLVRPTALILPLTFGLAGLLMGVRVGRVLGRTCVVALLAFLVCVPWGLRNQQVFGRFTLSAFNAGPVLWFGNHEGGPNQRVPPRFKPMNIEQRDRAMRAEALDFIKRNPGTYARLAWDRSVTAIRSETIAVVWNEAGIAERFGGAGITALKVLASAAWWALLSITTACLIYAWRRGSLDASDLVLLLLVGGSAAPFVLVDSQDRYHLPMVPLMMVLCGRHLEIAASRLGRAGVR
jgi:4-amino-4-deoxy-L-arabinose transferase-like glycosyltransferase